MRRRSPNGRARRPRRRASRRRSSSWCATTPRSRRWSTTTSRAGTSPIGGTVDRAGTREARRCSPTCKTAPGRSGPRTILVDSEQLESGEALSPEFKRVAATEIEEFTADYLRRFPGRSAEDIDDAQILREVMNTVGKKGKLGEPVRCVVSVSMLTEGWDANTVSHILGVRAFGTQLLCEQVVGRGLRRRSYAADENGFFTPEYADVYGVPFQFIPTVAKTRDLTLKPTRRVHADPDRAAAQITFPRLTGYRIELPDEELWAEFTERSHLALTTADLPTETVVSGLIGSAGTHTLDDLRQVREQEIAFHLAGRVMERFLTDGQDPKPWYFPQVLRITKDWLAQCVTCEGDTFPGLLLIAENADQAARLIFHESISSQPGNRARDPAADAAHPGPGRNHRGCRLLHDQGGLPDLGGALPRQLRRARRATRQHLGGGSCRSSWRSLPQVAAYVKNDHLGFTIPYVFQGRSRQYLPDFLVRLKPLEDERGDAHADRRGVRQPQAARADQREGRHRAEPLGACGQQPRRVRPLELLRAQGPGQVPAGPGDGDRALRAGIGVSAVVAP